MFETIIWATDGSEHADSTLPLVTELAAVHGSKIVALHLDELLRGRFGAGSAPPDEESLRAKISGQVDDLREAGFEVELELKSTHSLDTPGLIADAAEAAKADLIVIGTRGLAELGALRGDSVAKSLTHVARCPVLVVPPLREAAGAEGADAPAGVGA